MSGLTVPVLFFCLAKGAALGCLFLLLRVVRQLLGAGKGLTFLLDLLSGALAGAFVFLCALAVDRGFLRLHQLVLQGVGAWAAVQGLGGVVEALVRRAQKIFCKLLAVLARGGRFVKGLFPKPDPGKPEKKKKTRKKKKKPRKKTCNIM